MKQWIQKRLSWIDSQFISPPAIAEATGAIALRSGAGKIYFTVDGSDPRLPGGAVSPKAQPYQNPVSLRNGQRLLARSHHRNGWSALLDTSAAEAAQVKPPAKR